MSPPETPVRSDSFRPVLGATVLLALALLAIASLKSSRDLEAARDRERLLQGRITDTLARSERLRVRIDRLRHDPGMLERLAREDLGMVRPGDVIIELPSAGPQVPVPPSPMEPPALRSPHLPGPPLPVGEEGESGGNVDPPPQPVSSLARASEGKPPDPGNVPLTPTAAVPGAPAAPSPAPASSGPPAPE